MGAVIDGISAEDLRALSVKWHSILRASPQPGWPSRQEFIRWSIAAGYAPDTALLRRDNGKPHGPDNCYWEPLHAPVSGARIDHERAVSWNKTVNQFRRRLKLPLFPED